MKKIIKITALILLLSVTKVTALEINDCKVSEAYIHWASLSKEEQKKYIKPPYCESNGISNKNNFSKRLLKGIYPDRYVSQSTAVKDQGDTSMCWAYTSSTVLESHLLRKYNQTVTLSAMHMNYMLSQNFTDRTNPYGIVHDVNDGGNYHMASAYYTTQNGPVLDSEVNIPTSYNLPNVNSSTMLNKEVVADVNSVLIESRTTTGACTSNEIDLIKSLVYTTGPVGVSVEFYNYYLSSNNAYLYPTTRPYTTTNHAVTIIGWDDNYSKDNFLNKPNNNGAWIVQNSWGSYWGSNGTFYVSYEDPQVCTYIFSIKDVDLDIEENKYVYTYGTATSGYDYDATMNVFTKKTEFDEELKEVTFEVNDFTNTTDHSASSYNVYYYPGNVAVEGISLNNMTLIASGSVNYYGYVTVRPNEEIIIPAGTEEYSIAVAQSGYLPMIPKYTTYSYGDGSYETETAPEEFKEGVSYVYAYNYWYDLYSAFGDNSYKAPISAFTDSVSWKVSNAKVNYSYNDYFDITFDLKTKSDGLLSKIQLIKDNTVVVEDNLNQNITSGNTYHLSIKKEGLNEFVNGTYKLRVLVDDEYKDTNIDINVLPISGVSITNTKGLVLNAGKTLQMNVKLTPTNYNSTDPTITWESSDESIATINSNGLVTGINPGTVIITARTTNGLTATYTLVVNKPITSLVLDTNTISLNKGETHNSVVTINPIDTTDDKTLTWTSSNTSVATVNQNGTITAAGTGVATIKVTAKNGIYTTMTVFVNGISINKSAVSLELYKKYTLVATSITGYETTNNVTWTSSNPKVATVSSNGIVTAKTLGTTIITATDSHNTITSKVTVTKVKASSLSISTISDKVYNGKAQKPGIVIKYNGKTLKNNTDYTLKYSNNKNPGKAAIKITINSKSKIYTGTRTIYFIIKPKKTTIKTPTTSSKSVTARWYKTYGASGYQVGYKLKGGTWKFVYTTGLSRKFTGLTKGKYYQVIVRAYKTIDGKKYFGPWSVVKTIKCK